MKTTDMPRWYKCDIPKEALKALMQRNDVAGIVHTALYMTLLISLGVAAFHAIGSPWMVPAFFAYGSVYCFFNHMMHETFHGTPFRNRKLNGFWCWTASFFNGVEMVHNRCGHMQHHNFTYFEGDDPDLYHAIVDRLVDAWMVELDQFDQLNVLELDNNNERVGSGGYGYISNLPGLDPAPEHVRPSDMWGCSNAQIFSEVSPEMHWEFAIEHEIRWMERWGVTTVAASRCMARPTSSRKSPTCAKCPPVAGATWVKLSPASGRRWSTASSPARPSWPKTTGTPSAPAPKSAVCSTSARGPTWNSS